MCSLCRLPVAKNHNFGHILTFGGPSTDPLLPMRAKFSVLEQTHGVLSTAKFRLGRFILSPSGGENPQFFAVFGIPHLVVSPADSSLRKLNTGAQLQTFPYPRHQNRFSTQRLHGKIGRTNFDVQKRDGQTNKQTKRQRDKKLNVFGRPGGK